MTAGGARGPASGGGLAGLPGALAGHHGSAAHLASVLRGPSLLPWKVPARKRPLGGGGGGALWRSQSRLAGAALSRWGGQDSAHRETPKAGGGGRPLPR